MVVSELASACTTWPSAVPICTIRRAAIAPPASKRLVKIGLCMVARPRRLPHRLVDREIARGVGRHQSPRAPHKVLGFLQVTPRRGAVVRRELAVGDPCGQAREKPLQHRRRRFRRLRPVWAREPDLRLARQARQQRRQARPLRRQNAAGAHMALQRRVGLRDAPGIVRRGPLRGQLISLGRQRGHTGAALRPSVVSVSRAISPSSVVLASSGPPPAAAKAASSRATASTIVWIS